MIDDGDMVLMAVKGKMDARRYWTVRSGHSPIIATAIHDGHEVRPELLPLMSLKEEDRLREEDPFTSEMIAGLVNQITVHRSRFEIDLNRARDQAIYLDPSQAWGLEVWRDRPDNAALEQSLAFHDDYYAMLTHTLGSLEKRHGAFVVLDIHSYNHRRGGPKAEPTPQQDAPDINIGTFSMDRSRWADVVETVIGHFRGIEIDGRLPDVRENVAFQGKGEQTRFIHQKFPANGCAIAIEFKKFFMDEWTGEPNERVISDIKAAISALEYKLQDVLRARS